MLNSDNDIVMLQEHWLTPANLHKFDDDCPGYLSFGSSAMGLAVESGTIYGLPFGGVMTLIRSKLHKCTQFVCSDER